MSATVVGRVGDRFGIKDRFTCLEGLTAVSIIIDWVSDRDRSQHA